MKENNYDEPAFFDKYSRMSRSVEGLDGAGEWHALQGMLPDFQGRRVLDLGCGFGWHCIYAVEQGARHVTGVDLSERMIDEARRRNPSPRIEYRCSAIEDVDYPTGSFDIVISSLAFHYLESFGDLCARVARWLTPGGAFVFSVEHPVFTAYGSQQWHCDAQGVRLHWPVDRYFDEGVRRAVFLDEPITKYHRTLTTYVGDLLGNGFELVGLVEPKPDGRMLETVPGMEEELRRPMMLILSARKK